MTATGCQSLTNEKAGRSDKDPWYKFAGFGNKTYQTPASMAVVWTEDIMVTPGSQPTRGFGGRIYFYNERSQAVPVNGDLVIYGYDELGSLNPTGDQTKADKRFRFTAEQFTQHFSRTDLGASYSIWIPWDAQGGSRKKISLIPTFVTENGNVVRGEVSTLFLSGSPETNRAIEVSAPLPNLPLPNGSVAGSGRSDTAVQQASATMTNSALTASNYAALANIENNAGNKMKTTTISLPSKSTIARTRPVMDAAAVAERNRRVQELTEAIESQRRGSTQAPAASRNDGYPAMNSIAPPMGPNAQGAYFPLSPIQGANQMPGGVSAAPGATQTIPTQRMATSAENWNSPANFSSLPTNQWSPPQFQDASRRDTGGQTPFNSSGFPQPQFPPQYSSPQPQRQPQYASPQR
jgi:uncharacterized protein (DUF2141 family)